MNEYTAKPSGLPSEYDWKAPIQNTPPETTTLRYNIPKNGPAHISDDKGNEVVVSRNNIPAITCDGKPQSINVERLAGEVSKIMTGNGLKELNGQLRGQLPHLHNPIQNSLNAVKDIADKVQAASGSITYEGSSPLSNLCNVGKEKGILQR